MAQLEFTKRVGLPVAVVPAGTSVFANMSLHRRLWGFLSKEATQVFGVDMNRQYLMTIPGKVRSLLYPSGSSFREILEAHTLFGFYSRFVHKDLAAEWSRVLESESRNKTTKFISYRPGQVFFEKQLRWCPCCAAEQVQELGVALWKLIHQLPSVDVCARHGVRLESTCRHCGMSKIMLSAPLPSDPCEFCGCDPPPSESARPAASSGARKLAALCGEVANGRLGVFEPRAWAAGIRHAEMLAGSGRELAKLLQGRILDDWQVSTRQTEKVQSVRAFVKAELCLMNRAGDALPRAVVYVALRDLGLAHGPSPIASGSTEAQIEEMLASKNAPLGLVPAMLGRQSLVDLARNAGISKSHMHQTAAVRTWLSNLVPQLPSRSQARFAKNETNKRRDYYRKRLLTILDDRGPQTRESARKILFDQMEWLIRNDAAWVDEILPSMRVRPPRKAGFEVKREFYRQRIERVLATGVVAWSAVSKRSSNAFAWLSRNDSEWLEAHVQRQRVPNLLPFEKRLKIYRDRLAEIRALGYIDSDAIYTMDYIAAVWVHKYDRRWWNKNFN